LWTLHVDTIGLRDALRVQAAVDGPDLPGDVRGGMRGQEVDDAGNSSGFPSPSERDLRPERVEDLLRNAVDISVAV
jgi:hypothetical protein